MLVLQVFQTGVNEEEGGEVEKQKAKEQENANSCLT